MLRLILAATLTIAALTTTTIASAIDCRSGSCRVERSRTVERVRIAKERTVQRVRYVRGLLGR